MSGTYIAQKVTVNNYLADKLLASMTGTQTAGTAATASVGLFGTAIASTSPGDVLATYTAAAAVFDGYTPQALSLVLPVNLSQSCQGAIGDVSFVMTTTTAPTGDTIGGYYVYEGANVLWSEKFAGGETIPVARGGDYVNVNVAFPVQSQQATS